MNDPVKILVATATYNEVNNIREFISRVKSTMGSLQEILIVDDNSPDGTSDIINEIKLSDNTVHLITRPSKLGLGSAHKLMKVYAIAHKYEYLVTLDADLSHRPEEIPKLLAHAGENTFVIGSRYALGGKCDYVGFRKIISSTGNYIAGKLLGISLSEFTTSFRIFDVNMLEKTPLYRLKSNGYTYFVEVISLMDELGIRVVEVPIHFKDRKNDVSKIPKSQAVKSMFNLIVLAVRRRLRILAKTNSIYDCEQCKFCCEQTLLSMSSGEWNVNSELPVFEQEYYFEAIWRLANRKIEHKQLHKCSCYNCSTSYKTYT
jgi:glycosyltransferase involved in cell wall biosynthesis